MNGVWFNSRCSFDFGVKRPTVSVLGSAWLVVAHVLPSDQLLLTLEEHAHHWSVWSPGRRGDEAAYMP